MKNNIEKFILNHNMEVSIMYDMNKIPEDLKSINQWIAFNGKVPVDAKTGTAIDATDEQHWLTFEQVTEATKDTEYNIGLVTGGTCNLAVVDIDKCIDESGNLSDMAQDCIATINSYTEYSKSGNGVHIYFWGTLPNTFRNRYNGLEFYWRDRAIIVTGNAIPQTPSTVFAREKEAIIMHYKYMPGHADELGNALKKLLRDEVFNSLASMPVNPTEDNPNDETNNSSVDLRLCNCIAQYTKDQEVIKKILFDFTSRCRSKWYDNKTYLDRTIDLALNKFMDKKDSQENYNNIVDCYDLDSDNYYLENKYLKDITENELSSHGNTGFDNFDEVTGGLFAGAYIVAGTSSVGKTTFCLQMANQLAEQKKHVLFFSIEQTKEEMLSKSLTYLYYKNLTGGGNRLICARDFRYGKYEAIRDQYIEEYKDKIAPYMRVVSCNFKTKIHDISEYIKLHIDTIKTKPIVFIDYLQVIRTAEHHREERLVVNQVMEEIREMAKMFRIPIIVISSVNRSSYYRPLDATSPKESGQVEFTADCVLGLELNVFYDEEYKKLKSDDDKLAEISKAENHTPRYVNLRAMKNRFGDKNFTCKFCYYPQEERFMPLIEGMKKNYEDRKSKKVKPNVDKMTEREIFDLTL
ncbi:DnaB-like helicase C-terminal domain-containing protein [Cloacibacillus sp. An23]|uniref:DnaB-like helicase C-terminal domain-containing protein n=1 Tax=Cloacibacillus sp. An23 TaxID=1965591 RepID=UPI000B370746|nr:DnaB-like helicase C-terminal domain-containing protein [Cloacibacillus sp. An23]OUO94847.1 hypothetical protein B5F39_02975 [Cloacibacillus sp. An23]